MTHGKMHDDEVDTDSALVRRLLAVQFPQWSELPIVPVASAGTDNVLYQLGDDMAVRLPRIDWAIGQVHKEHEWLPRLAPHLPLAIPTPLAMGEPGEGYPWHWSVYKWLKGENATPDRIADLNKAAVDLAHFINALQQIDSTGGPDAGPGNFYRGVPLAMRDPQTRAALSTLQGVLDTNAATAAWEAALQAPEWDGIPAWFHGDLLPGNLLFVDGRLSAIIDFGGLAIGDPTCDLMIAWGLFSGKSRNIFRAALQIDDATWARGRGWALSQAAIFIPYYLNNNPVGVKNALRQVKEVLAEYLLNG